MEFLMLILTWLSLQLVPKEALPTFQTVPKAPESATATEAISDKAYKVQFEVRLGTDQGGCRDRGLCYIRIWFLGKAQFVPEPRTGFGEGSFENDRLTILFDLGNMEPKTREAFFGSGNFVVEEDYSVTDEVANALNIKSYTIKKGSYPIKMVSKNIAEVVF